MNFVRALMLSVLLVTATSACAMTTSEFLKFADNQGPSRAVLIGYVAGAVDMAGVLTFAASELPQYCAPENVKTEQILAVSKRYMESNPKDWHLPPVVLIYRALQNAWPCQKK